MEYVTFTVGFVLIHIGAYFVAGMVNYSFTKDLYNGKDALYAPFLRDMADPAEAPGSATLILPAQILRGVLMAAVLLPIASTLAELGFGLRAVFLGGLMLVYADVAAATPFSNTIEGLVYLKRRYITANVFWRIQSEAVLYSVLFGLTAGWLLF